MLIFYWQSSLKGGNEFSSSEGEKYSHCCGCVNLGMDQSRLVNLFFIFQNKFHFFVRIFVYQLVGDWWNGFFSSLFVRALID